MDGRKPMAREMMLRDEEISYQSDLKCLSYVYSYQTRQILPALEVEDCNSLRRVCFLIQLQSERFMENDIFVVISNPMIRASGTQKVAIQL